MALWLFRAGKSGEYENKFLSEGKIYLTWDELNVDLKTLKDRQEMLDFLLSFYEDAKRNTVRNWLGQIYPIAHRLELNDWIVMPSKHKPVIHIGKVTGEYQHHSKNSNPFFHSRNVDWFATDIPRSKFDQDLLYSFGAFMTVCQISRNNAEERIRGMYKNGWKSIQLDLSQAPNSEASEESNIEISQIDLEEFANDQIAKLIIRKFKGHRMEYLIESILQAKGYTTYHSPEGADKGIDILAAPEPMGFGQPRLCVQVKSSESPLDRPTLDQLIGAIHNFGADQGLLVSWGGFKNTVEKERPNQFFKVRLWGQNEIIKEILKNYDKLDDDIKADIPLKKIWTLSISDD